MEKELTNFENWFKNLGFETNDKIDDNVLKKYATYSRINTNRTYDFDFALSTYSQFFSKRFLIIIVLLKINILVLLD